MGRFGIYIGQMIQKLNVLVLIVLILVAVVFKKIKIIFRIF